MLDPAPYFRSWRQVLDRSNKSSTLKFAWARLLLDEALERGQPGEELVVETREHAAPRFLDYYFLQVFRFRLRQSFHASNQPAIVRILRRQFPSGEAPPVPSQISPEARSALEEEIAKGCFKDVRAKFHNLPARGRVEVSFYKSGPNRIVIGAPVVDFLRTHQPVLRDLVLFHWAKRLERWNTSPRVAAKVSSNAKTRSNQGRYLKDLRTHDSLCFFCSKVASDGTGVHVDHFLPWSFVFEDALWNLVIACKECNLSKSDRLPDSEDYLGKLLERNRQIQAGEDELAKKLSRSLDALRGIGEVEARITRLYEDALASGFAGGWKPSTTT